MTKLKAIYYYMFVVSRYIHLVFMFGVFVLIPIVLLPLSILSILFLSPYQGRLSTSRDEYNDDEDVRFGASPKWRYRDFKDWKIFKIYRNIYDGQLGHSGWSMQKKGKEGKWYNRWQYAFLRNPTNGFRNIINVNIEDLDMSWVGTRAKIHATDKVSGWCFVKGVHKETGKRYYGYEATIIMITHRLHLRAGYKIDAEKNGKDIISRKELKSLGFQLFRRELNNDY